jgi:hypothetical protein
MLTACMCRWSYQLDHHDTRAWARTPTARASGGSARARRDEGVNGRGLRVASQEGEALAGKIFGYRDPPWWEDGGKRIRQAANICGGAPGVPGVEGPGSGIGAGSGLAGGSIVGMGPGSGVGTGGTGSVVGNGASGVAGWGEGGLGTSVVGVIMEVAIPVRAIAEASIAVTRTERLS